MRFGNQTIEPGIQAYTGNTVIATDQISKGTKFKADRNYTDQRIAATFVLYPKPFGIQSEYNIGRGPEFNTVTDSIHTGELHGGYITASYKMDRRHQVYIPFLLSLIHIYITQRTKTFQSSTTG